QQLTNLANYQNVSPAEPVNTLTPGIKLDNYSRGIGSHLLPGGMDSESRFVKETFTKMHAPLGKSERENVTNYFHILHAVDQQKGLDEVAPDTFEYTIYSDGVNLTTGTLYYTTYGNSQINAVSLRNANLNSRDLVSYPMLDSQEINHQN
ncbi:MAG: linear amide C-N hydrolase, partial [Limosilactobacillus sp.]